MKQRSCIVVNVHKTVMSLTLTPSLVDGSYLLATFYRPFLAAKQLSPNQWISEEPVFSWGGGGARKGKWILLVRQDASHQVNFSFLNFLVTHGTQLLCDVLRLAAKDIMLQQSCEVTTKSKCIKRIEEPSKYHEVTASTTTTPPPRGEQQAYTHNAQ